MPTIEISQRLRLHYLDYQPDSKPAVLLLHGLGVTGNSWQLQFPPLLGAGFRVIAPDARGFGTSTYPGGSTSIAEMAGDIIALLERLQTGPVHVAGISMGGTHALQLVLDAPQLVRKLVLVNTFARLRPEKINGYFYFLRRFILVYFLNMRAQSRLVAQHLFPDPAQEELRQQLIEQILQADPKGYRGAMRALGAFNVESRLGEIRAPTLVITGERDTTVPPHFQRSLAEGIPNARRVIIPGAGHAVIADQPAIFNETLLEFLNSTE